MKIALLSDTHGQPLDGVFAALRGMKPDLLIHAGDLAAHHHQRWGQLGDADDRADQARFFLETWNKAADMLDCPLVIIPGNHDFFLTYPHDVDGDGESWAWPFDRPQAVDAVPAGWVSPTLAKPLDPRIKILNGSGMRVNNFRLWGSPWTPHFNGWAYNFPMSLREGAQVARDHWADIPADTDILITHGPPYGILDQRPDGARCGCQALRDVLDSGRIAPKLHVFGHIHSACGQVRQDGTLFVNAAMTDEENRMKRAPTVVEI